VTHIAIFITATETGPCVNQCVLVVYQCDNMNFSVLRNILLLISTIELPSLACISRAKSSIKALVQTQIDQPEPDDLEKKSNTDFGSEFLESPEGVTFVWLGKIRPERGRGSESGRDENETLTGLRVKRGVHSVYYYEVRPDSNPVEMPWHHYDHPQEGIAFSVLVFALYEGTLTWSWLSIRKRYLTSGVLE